MWGSVETTVKLGLTGLAGFTLACIVIETAGTVIGTAVAGSSDGQNYVVTRTVVELLLAVWKSTSASGALARAVRNRHRHAVEQAPRRWRGGRRDDSARTRRKI